MDPSHPRSPLSRRVWCAGSMAAALGLSARSVFAAPPSALELDLPQLQYPGTWNPRPGAMKQLAAELRLRTRLAARHEPSIVGADSNDLFATPFLYVAGSEGLPPLGPKAEGQLRRFVDFGGILVFDDAGGGAELGFRDDARELVDRLLPGSRLSVVGAEHVLHRSFYIVDEPMGRTRTDEAVHAVQEEGRIKILYLPNDLGGALSRGDDGLYRHACTPGGEVQREWAIRFAVNILLYATCTDYKSDPAHVQTLLHARRWR